MILRLPTIGGGQVHHEMDDDKGTSLVLVNTAKGKEALDFSTVLSYI